MTIRSQRLATALLRIFQGLRIFCILAAVVLVAAMLFAFLFPGNVMPQGVRVNGVAGAEATVIAGPLLLIANLFLAGIVVALTQLIGLMRSVVARAPFDIANVGRLRRIAGVLAAFFVFKASTNLVFGAELRRLYRLDGGSFDFGLFLGALTILVLAEVFREGARLAAEAEGTV